MNYTMQANEALRIAREVARDLEHPYIGTEHLLVGLKRVYTGVGGQVLSMNGVKDEEILRIMDEQDAIGRYKWGNLPENFRMISDEISRNWDN